MAQKIRIFILLVILFLVAVNAWQTRTRVTSWDQSLWVAIYPVNGDNSVAAADYICCLDKNVFQPIAEFAGEEAKRYGVALPDPVLITLAPEVASLPPAAPMGGNLLSVVWWSLKLRYWALVNDTYHGPAPDARMFVAYFDPATHKELAQSVGVKEGMIGVVNAFANRKFAARNNVILLHEFLHTLGATDKYDLATGLPFYPSGYAAPAATPLYPQKRAEIMGGAVPVSATEAVMPANVWQTMVGEMTATEIGWLRP